MYVKFGSENKNRKSLNNQKKIKILQINSDIVLIERLKV
jgi:hypothetical protein